MPSPLPPPTASKPATKPPRSLRAAVLRLLGWVHNLVQHSWRALLTLLCVLLYLWLIGVPGFLVTRWLRHLENPYFRVVLDRLRFDPTAGLVADGVFLYRQDDFSEPVARVGRVTIRPDGQALRQRQLAVRSLTIENGALRLPDLARSNQAPVRVSARAISGHILLFPDRVELAPLNVQAFGLNWESTGAVLRLPGVATRGFWPELHRALDTIGKAPHAVGDVAAELNALRFQPSSRARVGFRYEPARTNGWDIHIQAETRQAEIRGATFDSVTADVVIRGYQLALRTCTVSARDKRGELTGAVDLATRQAEARLYSDLPPQPWIAMMPRRWQEELRAAGLEADGSMKSEVWIGPAPLDQLDRSLHGWISLDKAAIHGMPLDRGYASVRVTGDTVQVENLSAVVGRTQGRGPLEGSITWQRDRRELEGDLHLNFDPHLAQPILPDHLVRLINRFTFPGPPPRFSGHFHYAGGADRTLHFSGQLESAASTYRNVHLTSIVAGITFSNQMLSLKPWTFRQPGTSVSGELHYDVKGDVIVVDLAGDMSPHAVAGLVGPGLARVLAPTRYDGPLWVHAHGVVDRKRSAQRTDLMVHVQGQRMGVSNWLADTARFDLQVRGDTYSTTNVTGEAFGGPFTAEVLVEPDAAGTSHVIHVTAALTNAELARIVAQVRTNDTLSPEGRLRLNVKVSGPVDDPTFRLLTGKGDLHVEDGEIMRLPVFGGLSRLLSALYPGLGFAAQNDLHGQFEIRNGRVFTKDTRLEGMVLSMKVTGAYAFDGTVRFNVEVQLLRKGPLAAVLRFITLPVTKLLVFQLTGTLNDPQWRPANLPKELFLIFE